MCGLKTYLQQCISEPIVHGVLVGNFKGFIGKSSFTEKLKQAFFFISDSMRTLSYSFNWLVDA